ncbi:unnamed protein product [Urochloa decumbens]|uniref:HMA domain-containing protein n=1 Tax=Urochloa decumbens TaxID=240449 RepID=A0ABC9FBF0_9POAL
MESTALIASLPLLTCRCRSKPLFPASFTRARRPASISLSSGSGRGILFSRRGRDYAGVGSSVSAAAAAGEAADGGSEAILLSVQGMMCDGCAASVKRILESQRLHLLLLISRKQVQSCGQQLKLWHRMIGRSNVERNLLNTLALVDLSLGYKSKVKPNKLGSEYK